MDDGVPSTGSGVAALHAVYDVAMTDLQVLAGHVAHASGDWAAALGISASSCEGAVAAASHLVAPFSVLCGVKVCRAASNDMAADSARLDVSATLPRLAVSLNEQKIAALQACAQALTAPDDAGGDIPPASEVFGEAVAASALDFSSFAVVAPQPEQWRAGGGGGDGGGTRSVFLGAFRVDDLMVDLKAGPDGTDALVGICVQGMQTGIHRRTRDTRADFTIAAITMMDHMQPPGSPNERLLWTHQPASPATEPCPSTAPQAGAADDAFGDAGTPPPPSAFVHLSYYHVDGGGGGVGGGDPAPGVADESVTASHFALPEGRGQHEIGRAAPPTVLGLTVASLFVNVNSRTIAVLLDFAESAASQGPAPGPGLVPPPTSEAAEEEPLQRKYKLTVSMELLTLNLTRDASILARVAIRGLAGRVDAVDGFSAVTGSLADMSVTDCTPAGSMYPAVFQTGPGNVLTFELVQVDVDSRLRDVPSNKQLTLRMASVQYVHTRRFQTQLQNFIEQFLQQRSLLNQLRRASRGLHADDIGLQHLMFNIEIDRPVAIIPRNSFSTKVIRADLGLVTLTNELVVAPGVQQHLNFEQRDMMSLIDHISVTIQDMNL